MMTKYIRVSKKWHVMILFEGAVWYNGNEKIVYDLYIPIKRELIWIKHVGVIS